MAAKYGCWKVHKMCLGCVALLCAIAASFVALQQACLNNTTDAFVDNYCLSDSNMRTVIATYITVFSTLLCFMVGAAFNAYRVGQLKHGIGEGVYIALSTSSPWRYQRRTLLLGGKWGAMMVVVLFLFNVPNLLQTVTNPFIYTNTVYVRNKSTARVVPSVQNYSTPQFTSVLDQLAQEGASAFQVEQVESFTNFLSAFTVLLQVRAFSGGDSSTKSGDGTVTTHVVRYSYLDSTVNVDGDLSNALRQQDTLATISTRCSTAFGVAARLADLQAVSSQSFNVTTQASTFIGECAECQPLVASQTVYGNTTTCHSTTTFANQEFIYTVGTGGVTPLRSLGTTTSVDPYTAGILTAGYAASADNSVNLLPPNSQYIDALLAQYLAYPQGLFDSRAPNLIHNKLCSAASQTLGQLWSQANNGGFETDGRAALATVPLYNIVLLTHISTRTAAITVGVLIAFGTLVSAFGMVCAHHSPINITAATGNAWIASVDDEYIRHKWGASNDPDLLIDSASEFPGPGGVLPLLHCRAVPVTPNPRPHTAPSKPNSMIFTLYGKNKQVPDKWVDYC